MTVGGVHECVARGHDLLIVSQGGPGLDAELGSVVDGLPEAAIGVGLERSGLEGARLSIGDAERALILAARGAGISRFEEDWFRIMVLAAHDRLKPILERGIETARAHPQLSETIAAYAGSGFSISGAARQLGVHPNSAVYRLDRWRHLTGWDPRTHAGLIFSLAAWSS